MAKFTVFHGSYTEIKIPEIRQAKNTKDFGVGFYCTTIREQAIRWAKRYQKAVLNKYTVNLNNINQLKIKEFDGLSEEWLDFIIACRSGQNHHYDIVSGAMANDQIYNYISDYIEGALTREQFWVMAKFKYPTQQIVFCTEKALKTVEFSQSEEIKNEW